MNTPLARHPSRAELEQYGLGRLRGPACDWIESHVAGCDECCAALLKLSDDTFVRLAQGAATKSLDSIARATRRAPQEIPIELRNHPRYRVLGLIGVGGMGAVFKAEHRVMERLVALKVIHSEFVDNPQAVERFKREVKAAARLAHPNIVVAFDAEQAGGLHFLVMEFVDGVSLDRYISQHGPLEPLAAARLTRQAALALDHAHQRGMVHRDIKPQNLMLRRNGQLKVLDFGLARLAESPFAPDLLDPCHVPSDQRELRVLDPSERRKDAPQGPAPGAADAFNAQRTTTGMLLGTPDFLAPEQARDPRSADIRADIYALGCTLFYLIHGAAPFARRPLRETLLAHAAADRRPLLDSLRNVPVKLREVLGRMLAANPADRFQTPAELARTLAKVIAEIVRASEVQQPDSPDIDVTSIDEALLRKAVPLEVGVQGGTNTRPVFTRLRAAGSFAALPNWRSLATGMSKTRAMAAVLIAIAVCLSIGLALNMVGNRGGANDHGGGDVDTFGQAASRASSKPYVTEATAAPVARSAASATSANVAMDSRRSGVRARPYELPENIDGRRLVLFVLPKRDLWMPDYGPLRGKLERNGRVKVVTASTEPGICAIHAKSPQPDTPVEADTTLTLDLLSQRDFSALIFVGYDTAPFISGSHAKAAKEVIAGMAAQGKLVGSICVGQSVLAHHQVLLGREAAWGENLQGLVSASQARWRSDQRVVVDRSGSFTVVTAATDKTAVEFAEAILEILEGG